MALWLFLTILLTQGLPRADAGTISGVVRLPEGLPAAGVRVAAMVPPERSLNGGNASELAAIGKTDELGRYRLEDVPVGRYYIVAGRVDAPTYYPGVATAGNATAISVAAGATVDNIDFQISSQSARVPDRKDPIQQLFSSMNITVGPPVQASGRIVMDSNSPDKKLPPWVTLNARNDGNTRFSSGGMSVFTSGGSYAIKSTVAPDGSFSISLQPGESTISVQGLPEGYSVKSMRSGSTNLQAQPVKVETGMAEIVIVLTADLRPRFTVEGRVLSAAANRNLIGEQIELLGDSGLIARIILDVEGQFVFRKVLPGNYRLRISSLGLNAPEQRITVPDHDLNGVEFVVSDPGKIL